MNKSHKNMTGDKINYSLRMKKNVERKIFLDIIRSLSYFGPVNQYRYIGFGSCYYKDFLLFHEKLDINNGISIELDNAAYSNYSEKKQLILEYIKTIFGYSKDRITDLIVTYINDNKLGKKSLEAICEMVEMVIIKYALNFLLKYEKEKSMEYIVNGSYDYKGIKYYNSDEYQGVLLEDIISEVCNHIDYSEHNGFYCKIHHKKSRDELIDNIKSCINMDTSVLISKFSDLDNNRYIFNKPYGFIDIVFSELNNALDKIAWSENQNNIIWLDYDKFIESSQLDGLEKTIKKANRGDLIIFSTSMGTETDLRLKSLTELKEESNRFNYDIKLKECDRKVIHQTISKIVKDVTKDVLSKKNDSIPENGKRYDVINVCECKYDDGTPMYTYAFIILYEEEKDTFPIEQFKAFPWYRNNDIYDIKLPALTHKEVNAINQFLPNSDVNTICSHFPFINKKEIECYVKIWKYFPNLMEVESFV